MEEDVMVVGTELEATTEMVVMEEEVVAKVEMDMTGEENTVAVGELQFFR